LGEPRALIFRGDGGESERRPGKPCETLLGVEGRCEETRWPAVLDGPQAPGGEAIEPGRLEAVWRGREADDYGEASVVGTAALALWAIGAESDRERCEARAHALWDARGRS